MTFEVDFHMRDDEGRVIAFVDRSALGTTSAGDVVLVEDDEGNRCKATVEEVSRPRSVVFLSLMPGTSDPSPHSRWLVEETQREVEEPGPTPFERFHDLAVEVVHAPKG